MFGADKQVSGRGQTYLSDIGLTVMWEKQGTSTPQSEEAEFDLLCQLSPGLAPHPPPCRGLFLRCCEVMTSANSLSLILRRLDEIERKLDRILEELQTPTAIGHSARRGNLPGKD